MPTFKQVNFTTCWFVSNGWWAKNSRTKQCRHRSDAVKRSLWPVSTLVQPVCPNTKCKYGKQTCMASIKHNWSPVAQADMVTCVGICYKVPSLRRITRGLQYMLLATYVSLFSFVFHMMDNSIRRTFTCCVCHIRIALAHDLLFFSIYSTDQNYGLSVDISFILMSFTDDMVIMRKDRNDLQNKIRPVGKRLQ